MKRVVLSLLRIAVITIVVLFVFTQFIRRTGMFFPERYPSGNWTRSSLASPPVDIYFKTDDRLTLHGWLFRAKDTAAPFLVWCHGNGGNLTESAPIAAELARRGLNVLVFDWRGYGKSEGSPSESTLYGSAAPRPTTPGVSSARFTRP